MNFRFPVFLDLTGKTCVVTGAGFEVAGKVKALVEAGATVRYVNPEAESAIQELAAANSIQWDKRVFEPGDLGGCFLIIADLDDNSEVFRLAEERNVLCNSVDDPPYCRFSFGSVHRRGDLTIAISTNGWAPAVAARLRQRFEEEIGPEYGELLAILKEIRPEISQRILDFGARRELWYRIVDSPVLKALGEDDRAKAAEMIREMIEEAVSSTSHSHTSGDNVHP